MRVPLALTILFLSASAESQTSHPRSWQDLQPGKSTRAEVVFLLGVPDYVTTSYDYEDFVGNRARPKPSRDYDFHYFGVARKNPPILEGPFGTASSAVVMFVDDKLSLIEFSYTGTSVTPQTLEGEGYSMKAKLTDLGTSYVAVKKIGRGEVLCILPPKTQKLSAIYGETRRSE